MFLYLHSWEYQDSIFLQMISPYYQPDGYWMDVWQMVGLWWPDSVKTLGNVLALCVLFTLRHAEINVINPILNF